ncbi:cytidylyltransferase domain-containing protein [Fredinandcohnia onubensis]|uniref:cytidylyltransferase domain-containing protein n=1 Tax=Fredinandcohnia onubensis TaxID=1571209 RepID=UPI000C0BF30A|nr:glycosyltransferase family protein [Fredinandcohnia onubensis]
MKIVATIQARMGSTRLPGKVLKKVLGKPLLEYQIERLKKSKIIDKIVVATTTKKSDQAIIDLCERLSIDYTRGSEEDVLARYYNAALESEADIIVRITSDCPLISPSVIDQVITTFLQNAPRYDFVSNTIERTYPRGFDTEVFAFNALEQAYKEGFEYLYREHVTTYILRNPTKFQMKNVKYKRDLSKYRLTVDTEEDYELIRNIIEILYPKNPNFELEDIIRLLEKRSDLFLLNAHVQQKSDGENIPE